MPGMFSVHEIGFTSTLLKLDEARMRFPLAPREIVRGGSDIILDALRRLAPKRTGRLAAGLRSHVRGTLAWFTSSASYSGPVIRGARPHLIVPSHQRALSWLGALHPVRRVHHPGNRPNPFPKRAMQESKPLIMELSRRVAREVFG